ncbi:Flp pilus assembly protein CpaB [Primorskyibacter aestuariivivens]|uniref:Flp pilus assembly protein CpaB n=1 Tax=Primorskyibacter aestuariivivens TaxID=1888912 RepID=UPI002300AD01|nr:Flp pilus assembly protein CpaB [Primorskyibacter aestuariivivens]MDA7427618.1 Flp pilus assembly protein CpaB [Primorskyibacter aestuariivivens]
MRFSTVFSFILAVVLAVAAVFGAQNWLNLERQQLVELLQQQQATPVKEEPKNTIVVAAEPIGFGELMGASKVREITWAEELRPEGSYQKIGDLVVGETDETARYALTQIAVGEPILKNKVTEPGQRAKLSTALSSGKKAISVRVNDVSGVAGFVLPGDRVDIMLTRDGYVDVLLQGMKVLAIDQIADDRKDNPSVVRTVTFEVDTKEAQKLILASQVGSLSLALRNLSSTDFQEFERVTIGDLSEQPDPSDDLIEANRATDTEETKVAAVENDQSPFKSWLKRLADEVSERAANLEGVQPAPEPVIIEKEVIKEVIVEVEKLVPAPVITPSKSTIGVIRNGSRAEYKVNREGQLVDENGNLVEDEVEIAGQEDEILKESE